MDQQLKQELLLMVDEMRAMGVMIDRFATNPYERERGHRMIELAVKLASLIDQDHSPETIHAIFFDFDYFRASPVIAADAAVFNAQGELLLIQRTDSQLWALPGGLAEVGRSISESAVLELWEEAGLRGTVMRLLGIFDGRFIGSTAKFHLVHVVHQLACADLKPSAGIEALDVRFFAESALPPLHGGHQVIVPQCFKLKDQPAYFDPATAIGVEMPMGQRPK